MALLKGLEYIREIPKFTAVKVFVIFPQFSRDVFAISAFGRRKQHLANGDGTAFRQAPLARELHNEN